MKESRGVTATIDTIMPNEVYAVRREMNTEGVTVETEVPLPETRRDVDIDDRDSLHRSIRERD